MSAYLNSFNISGIVDHWTQPEEREFNGSNFYVMYIQFSHYVNTAYKSQHHRFIVQVTTNAFAINDILNNINGKAQIRMSGVLTSTPTEKYMDRNTGLPGAFLALKPFTIMFPDRKVTVSLLNKASQEQKPAEGAYAPPAEPSSYEKAWQSEESRVNRINEGLRESAVEKVENFPQAYRNAAPQPNVPPSGRPVPQEIKDRIQNTVQEIREMSHPAQMPQMQSQPTSINSRMESANVGDEIPF